MKATLLVVTGNTTKRQVTLRLPCVLGRSREADITVPHPQISRRHCRISETNGLLMLRDLDSLNGTMIGGRRIATAPLLPEAEFTIGPLTFRVQYNYEGNPQSLPPISFVNEAEADIDLAAAAAASSHHAPSGDPAAAARRSDSEIRKSPDFAAWADADPDQVALALPAFSWPQAMPAKPPIEPKPPVPSEPHEDDPSEQSCGMPHESPWATQEPAVERPKIPPETDNPRAPSPPASKPPSYNDNIDPEFGSFLNDLP